MNMEQHETFTRFEGRSSLLDDNAIEVTNLPAHISPDDTIEIEVNNYDDWLMVHLTAESALEFAELVANQARAILAAREGQ
jgi:hypothetical protein